MSGAALAQPLRRIWTSAKHRLRLAFERLDRSIRWLLVKAGLPVPRRFLVLRCASGPAVSGFFSEFAAVLGALEHLEFWRPIYAGLRVEFGVEGLYYDPARGENWWEYFFAPLEVGSRRDARIEVVSERQHDLFAYRLPKLSRPRGHELIERYIRPQAWVQDRVDAFVRERFGDAYVVGVHYRGTDKHEDAPRVAYERVRDAVQEALEEEAGNSAPRGRQAIFLATDEQAFLDYMLRAFPGRLHYLEMYRSVDGKPIDVILGDNFKKGSDAVLDCLLLARCHFLVRTASNLSMCSILFNPRMPEVALNREA